MSATSSKCGLPARGGWRQRQARQRPSTDSKKKPAALGTVLTQWRPKRQPAKPAAPHAPSAPCIREQRHQQTRACLAALHTAKACAMVRQCETAKRTEVLDGDEARVAQRAHDLFEVAQLAVRHGWLLPLLCQVLSALQGGRQTRRLRPEAAGRYCRSAGRARAVHESWCTYARRCNGYRSARSRPTTPSRFNGQVGVCLPIHMNTN